MGVDLYGQKPTSKVGQYFGNGWYFWHPLADYCITIAPDTCGPCSHWYSNYGDGLDAVGAVALAEALQKEIDSGRTEVYARKYASEQGCLPDEVCGFCMGGTQYPDLHLDTGDLKPGGVKCNWCQGTGHLHPLPPFSTENVTAFIAFLRECGGFSIL